MRVSPDQFEKIARSLPEIGRDPASIRKRIETMEALLERGFTMPGINRQFGLDAIIGLIPVLGDLITTAMGAWIVWEARNLGMSKFQITRMAANVGVDSLLGLVPFVGDAMDFFFRSNTKNLKIIKKHLDRHHPSTMVIDA